MFANSNRIANEPLLTVEGGLSGVSIKPSHTI